jgi:Protein of unknown function (DUF1553)/Protein of unknown function (DUF1549)/Bacterial Ig-like domain (group 2)
VFDGATHWTSIGLAALAVGVISVAMGLAADARAGLPEPPGPGAAGLTAQPARVLLRGPDAVQQLAVERTTGGAEPRDATTQVHYESSAPSVATVDESGLITARGDGQATITARLDQQAATVPVAVKDFAASLPVHFGNQVVPIFTKLGCNAGGCHGKASGQNGFRLSLLGFEPTLDYETIVKEGRGRRLFPAAPEASLLLQKATARMPHGGGKRLDPDSHEYRLIVRWIAAGMPVGKPEDPKVERISVYPGERVLPRGTAQQIVVTAHYTDGSTEDVTRWTQYQSNETEVAAVEPGGRVETRRQAGQAAIMARYQGQVAVFRATVPTGKAGSGSFEFPVANVIDAAAVKQWKALGIAPATLSSDAEFLRRASLDITGTLPTPDEVKAFIADPATDKRPRLIDRLLARPEYASYFAIKWADILRNKREGRSEIQFATFNFHDWIRESLDRNVPYDQFVRAIVAASGAPQTSPPVQWYRKLRETGAYVDDTAQVFLGMRLQCAKCHHHPFEKWSQHDYYGFAAFFARVGRKSDMQAQRAGRDAEVIYTLRSGAVSHPKTGETMAAKGLGGTVVPVAAGDDPRQKLVDWMADPKNPFFARALVNRYWAHFFGRGIVEPLDDMRLTNPPSNPDLLDALAAEFVKSGYDLKGLVRTICTSRVYGLGSVPSESGASDRQSFARHYPRRMGAEVLLDAIAQVSAVPTVFDGFPAGTRAIELPDESVGSTFLDAFGRPKRDTSCECERVTDATLSQSLMLLNSTEVQAKLAAPGGRAEALVKDPRPEAQKIEELFWAAFARPPSQREADTALAHISRSAGNKRSAYEDIIWALVNAKEFQFID